jgi:hypothetical protein
MWFLHHPLAWIVAPNKGTTLVGSAKAGSAWPERSDRIPIAFAGRFSCQDIGMIIDCFNAMTAQGSVVGRIKR